MHHRTTMNNTEDNSVINSSAINQTQSLSNDGSRAGNDLSLAVRIFNGIIISILFTIGASANLIVLHVLRRKRRRRILLKNTSVILANVMLADLLSCLIVLPHDLIFSVAYLTSIEGGVESMLCHQKRHDHPQLQFDHDVNSRTHENSNLPWSKAQKPLIMVTEIVFGCHLAIRYGRGSHHLHESK